MKFFSQVFPITSAKLLYRSYFLRRYITASPPQSTIVTASSSSLIILPQNLIPSALICRSSFLRCPITTPNPAMQVMKSDFSTFPFTFTIKMKGRARYGYPHCPSFVANTNSELLAHIKSKHRNQDSNDGEYGWKEYKRGITGWDFSIDDVKAQASLIPDEDIISEKDEDIQAKQLQHESSMPKNIAVLQHQLPFTSQYSDPADSDDNAPASVSSVDSMTNTAKCEKTNGNLGVCGSTIEQPTTTTSLGNDNHARSNSIDKPVSDVNGKISDGAATGSSDIDKDQNVSRDGPTNLQTIDNAHPKISANGDEADDKAKNPVVQQKGRFKVTSENVDAEKADPAPLLQKSQSMQIGVIVPHPTSLSLLPPDITSPNQKAAMFSTLTSVPQTNILQRDNILCLMKQVTTGDIPDIGCKPMNTAVTEKSLLEAAHEREKELLEEITDLQSRLLYRTENARRKMKFPMQNILPSLYRSSFLHGRSITAHPASLVMETFFSTVAYTFTSRTKYGLGFQCPHCPSFNGDTYRQLLAHIKKKHQNEDPNLHKKGERIMFPKGGNSSSQSRYKLYVGNIPRKWADNDLIEAVNKVGPGVTAVELIKGPQSSQNCGFAFVSYYNSASAEYSRQKMSSPNFKLDKSAPIVKWALLRSAVSSSSSQVKSLYLKNLPRSVTQNKVREIFEKYGKINEVVLPPAKPGLEMSRIGFVNFAERSSAIKALNEEYEIDGQFVECSLVKRANQKITRSQKE